MEDEPERAPAMSLRPHVQWYHGSPLRLETLAAGSTVTPIVELARVFSHKPTRVGYEVEERDGRRTATIEHNGVQPGFLHRVIVGCPREDLVQHPTSRMARGEEMVTTRDLPLEYLNDVPLGDETTVICE